MQPGHLAIRPHQATGVTPAVGTGYAAVPLTQPCNLKGSLEARVQVPALPPMTCPTFASAMTPEPQFTRETEAITEPETSLMGGYEHERN